MTFLRQVQLLLERTYAPTGINLEEFIIQRKRFEELSYLAGPTAEELSEFGRTFLRIVDGRLHVAIYYHPQVISVLEQFHPAKILCNDNIRALIIFLEEMNHAIHAVLLFLERRLKIGTDSLFCDLELQAKVDTYLVLKLFAASLQQQRYLSQKQILWLQNCLFSGENFSYQNQRIKKRYREANVLGLRLVQYIDRLELAKRLKFIKKFRNLSYRQKKIQILSLPES